MEKLVYVLGKEYYTDGRTGEEKVWTFVRHYLIHWSDDRALSWSLAAEQALEECKRIHRRPKDYGDWRVCLVRLDGNIILYQNGRLKHVPIPS